MGAAGGVAVHQGPEADLMGNAGAGDRFGEDADHEAEHGGTTIQEFNPLELLLVDQFLSAVLEPLIIGGGVGHQKSGLSG